jgi:hypothetical protein
LLVEIRIAILEIPSIASMNMCITTQIDSSLPDHSHLPILTSVALRLLY